MFPSNKCSQKQPLEILVRILKKKYCKKVNFLKSYISCNISCKRFHKCLLYILATDFTAHKMKFSIKDFFSKQDQICSFLRICAQLLKKSVMKNFIFCAVFVPVHLFSKDLSKCIKIYKKYHLFPNFEKIKLH